MNDSMQIPESCKVYAGVQIVNSQMKENVIIGEDSYINSSVLGNNVQVNRRNLLEDVQIGDYTFTGANTVIKHANIGKFCSISWNVSIEGGGARHNYRMLSTHPFTQLKSFGIIEKNKEISFGKTLIGNDVWIGMNSSILAGINIGDGAIIGAGSVVTKNVPAYAIVAGNPAKVIRYRFEDTLIEEIMKYQWWNWPENVIRENLSLFETAIDEVGLDKLKKIRNKIEQEGELL